MVNYCCVYGCGKNSKTSKHLYYYSLPKERDRLIQWLEAIGRNDLLVKDAKKLTHRVCSRHFTLSSIKNKHLCADAVPTLCIPNNPSENDGFDETGKTQSSHNNVICNSCNKQIFGFRYKCISCQDYDLCSKCEMFEAHAHHYLLRIPKPVNFLTAENLIKKWQKLLKAEQLKGNTMEFDDECSTDDDVPITKLAKNYDSGIELSPDWKAKIRNEVTRVLNINHTTKSEEEVPRKKAKLQKKVSKKKKSEVALNNSMNTEDMTPELVFADVNDIKGNQVFDVKDENSYTLTTLTEPEQPNMTQIKLNDELSEFLIGMPSVYPEVTKIIANRQMVRK